MVTGKQQLLVDQQKTQMVRGMTRGMKHLQEPGFGHNQITVLRFIIGPEGLVLAGTRGRRLPGSCQVRGAGDVPMCVPPSNTDLISPRALHLGFIYVGACTQATVQ